MRKPKPDPETEAVAVSADLPPLDLAPPEPTIPASPAELGEAGPKPTFVTGIRVRTHGPHEHDGEMHTAGTELSMPCDVARGLIKQGAVTFIRKEESTDDPASR